ncbi:MAG TPA: four helix bundle protein [Gemmatimonadales bacterium]|nr:four helix bundle protein [Gemmatimonadales bacterium]
MIRSHRDLQIWQRAMELSAATYAVASSLPSYEIYGLAQQLRRSAVSIPSNIAEGHGRIHRGDYVHHLSVSRGSLAELETQLELAWRIHAASVEPAQGLADEVGRMLNTLISRLRTTPRPHP